MTVVIPSIGDAALPAAVESVLESAGASRVDTEVIVVWQCDGMPEVPAHVRVLPTHRVGTAYARNRGVEAARAPLVGYLDEDEVADPRWVGEIVRSLADADAAFGPIDPMDDEGRPHCLTDHGDARIFPARTPPWLVGSGGNMVFRRESLMAVGRFDLHFGPGSIGISAEETELIWRLLSTGRAIRWAPDMIVHHPTKTDAEILASRYPYGFGAGRLLRKTRSPRLIGNYLHAVAHANVTALRRRDRRASREARSFGLGLVKGLARGGSWRSPSLASEDVPEAVAAALDGRPAVPLPVSFGLRPHYVWACGDAVLHAYVGPTDAQLGGVAARLELLAAAPGARVPAIRAHGRTRDALWVLEDRLDGAPLPPGVPETWWADAVAGVMTYATVPGPVFGESVEYRQDAASWVAAAPPELRDRVADVVERAATLPSGPGHGDLQPKNMLRTADGVRALDWEWCGTEGLRGMDLLFLAVMHDGVTPSLDVLRGLAQGRNPSFGDVLGPLAELGVRDEVLGSTIAALAVKWAANERRRLNGSPDAGAGTPYADMLAALVPAAAAVEAS